MNVRYWAADTEDRQEDADLDTDEEDEAPKGDNPEDSEDEDESEDEGKSDDDEPDVDEDNSAKDTTDWKALAQKNEKKAADQQRRAELAEKKLKDKKDAPADQSAAPQALSSKDYLALSNAKVHEDDVDEVIDFAKFKKISIAEALKTTAIKAVLAERSEHRTTAAASNTGRARPGNARRSGRTLLDKALKTGELPQSDDDMDAMLRERYKVRK